MNQLILTASCFLFAAVVFTATFYSAYAIAEELHSTGSTLIKLFVK